MSDDRLKNTQPKDEKTPKTIEDRSSPRLENLTDAEIDNLLNVSDASGILPQPPHKPGWHRIWLSETNQQNSIAWYERRYYTKVDPKDVPGFGQEYLKSPSGVEEVRCNEMILYEIPDNVYQRIMRKHHHDEPLHLQGQPVGDMQQKMVDPKTGETLFREEMDEEAKAESRRRVPTPRFEG